MALPFTDYDRAEHPVGETWWFRGWNYSPHDSGLSLFVSLDGEREWHFRMADWEGEQQGIIDALAAHVVDAEGPIGEQRVTEVPYGMKICLWCEGDRVCWFCQGEGVRDGQRCPECLGRRYCLSCTGSGLVAQDQRTDRLPVAPNEPAPTTASTKSSRSKT